MNQSDQFRKAGSEPQFSEWIPHVIKEGSRDHVIWYNGRGMHCSNPKCEINKVAASGTPAVAGSEPKHSDWCHKLPPFNGNCNCVADAVAGSEPRDPYKCEKCGAALGWCEPYICDKCQAATSPPAPRDSGAERKVMPI